MITQQAWMFLSSFEKLRAKLSDTVNMAHLGARAFEEIGGEIVQTTSFVVRNTRINSYKGTYSRLIDANSQQKKEALFLDRKLIFSASKDFFNLVPGAPVAYCLMSTLLRILGHDLLVMYSSRNSVCRPAMEINSLETGMRLII